MHFPFLRGISLSSSQKKICHIFVAFSGNGQKYGSDEPLVVPVNGPLAQFPALITADNFPLFPFTDQFNTGFEINPANKVVGRGRRQLLEKGNTGIFPVTRRRSEHSGARMGQLRRRRQPLLRQR